MARKALIVEFRNAAIFTDPARSSDRMIAGRERIKRKLAPRIPFSGDTLDVRHVANMLHVLMGERPVPSLRQNASRARLDEDIWRMARHSLVAIETCGEEETKTVRKAVKDSWNTAKLRYHLNGRDVMVKGGLLYHARLERFLGPELYRRFLEIVSGIAGCADPRAALAAHAAIELLNANNHRKDVQELAARCRQEGRTSFANLIDADGNPDSIDLHQAKRGSVVNLLVVNKGVERVRRLSGKIYVPLETDSEVERLRRGVGVATLLEGGFVRIVRIEDWTEDLIFGAKPVTEGAVHVPDQN